MATAGFVARLLRNPAEVEVDKFLQSRSGKQMVQLFRLIPEPAQQAALTARLLLLPSLAISGRRGFTATDKAKKALNAFVAFRCYYVGIAKFKTWPMKKLSYLVGLLWEADPNKVLWSLIAKAWSTIRDQIGKDKAPLDQFYAIICPHLNIPGPETYLLVLGWSVSVNEEGDPTISRDGSSMSPCVGIAVADIALSVEDIIAYVQSMGYANSYVANANNASATFLGHSVNFTGQKSNFALATTSTAAMSTDPRIIAKQKRRAKRDFARVYGDRAGLERDILNAHRHEAARAGEPLPERYPTPGPPDYGPNPFYDQLTGAFDGQVLDVQDNPDLFAEAALIDATSVSDDIHPEVMEDIALSAAFYPTDFDAFRPGADEDATLSAFDDVLNA